MGGRATFGSSSVDSFTQQALLDDTVLSRPQWSYYCRSPQTVMDKIRWRSLWPPSMFVGMSGLVVVGNDSLDDDQVFEPFSCGGDGTHSMKFIRGTALDSASAAISGARIVAMRTSDDSYGGEDISKADGTFQVPTVYGTAAHYIVAYLDVTTDKAGTTVNTLVPTNIDGS